MNENRLLREENRKIRQLQLLVDLTLQVLYQSSDLTIGQGLKHIDNVKKFALKLFPDKEFTFDIIYKPRFYRVLRERGILKISQN